MREHYKFPRIGSHELRRWCICPCVSEHLFRRINAGDPVPAEGEFPREYAVAAAEVEDASPLGNPAQNGALQHCERPWVIVSRPVLVVKPSDRIVVRGGFSASRAIAFPYLISKQKPG